MDSFPDDNESNVVESNEVVIQVVSYIPIFIHKYLDKNLLFPISKNNITMIVINHLNVEINFISIRQYNAYVYENERMTMTRWYWESIIKFPDGRLPREQNICRYAWKLFWTFASACNRYKSALRNIQYDVMLTR